MASPQDTRPRAQSAHDFSMTLPSAYRERFNPAEIAAHAHVVSQRGDKVVSVGTFPSKETTGYAICVNAVDRPGLLALISQALNECGYDVDSAEAFRRTVVPPEALDVFWIRTPHGSLDHGDVEEFATLLRQLLEGTLSEHVPQVGPPGKDGTTVRFIESPQGDLSILEVETSDRSGLLWAISRALHHCEVQIVSSQIRTKGPRVYDKFVIEEIDGTPITNERRMQIQIAVLSAL